MSPCLRTIAILILALLLPLRLGAVTTTANSIPSVSSTPKERFESLWHSTGYDTPVTDNDIVRLLKAAQECWTAAGVNSKADVSTRAGKSIPVLRLSWIGNHPLNRLARKTYQQFKTKIVFNPDYLKKVGAGGAYDPVENTIYLSSKTVLNSTLEILLLHEWVHLLKHASGFVNGIKGYAQARTDSDTNLPASSVPLYEKCLAFDELDAYSLNLRQEAHKLARAILNPPSQDSADFIALYDSLVRHKRALTDISGLATTVEAVAKDELELMRYRPDKVYFYRRRVKQQERRYFKTNIPEYTMHWARQLIDTDPEEYYDVFIDLPKRFGDTEDDQARSEQMLKSYLTSLSMQSQGLQKIAQECARIHEEIETAPNTREKARWIYTLQSVSALSREPAAKLGALTKEELVEKTQLAYKHSERFVTDSVLEQLKLFLDPDRHLPLLTVSDRSFVRKLVSGGSIIESKAPEIIQKTIDKVLVRPEWQRFPDIFQTLDRRKIAYSVCDEALF